jgi:hypothetical protein
MNVRSRYKTREPVEVVQQLESCHHESVTDFPLIEKSVFPEKYSDFRSKKGKNHPLKKAKSHKKISFYFESGHQDQSELALLTRQMIDEGHITGSCGFHGKDSLRLLQGADILVYELNKWFTELNKADLGLKARPVRKSMQALVIGKHIPLQFLTKSNLDGLFERAWKNQSPLIS